MAACSVFLNCQISVHHPHHVPKTPIRTNQLSPLHILPLRNQYWPWLILGYPPSLTWIRRKGTKKRRLIYTSLNKRLRLPIPVDGRWWPLQKTRIDDLVIWMTPGNNKNTISTLQQEPNRKKSLHRVVKNSNRNQKNEERFIWIKRVEWLWSLIN